MHRSLSIELDLSSPTKRFSLVGLEFQSGNLFSQGCLRLAFSWGTHVPEPVGAASGPAPHRLEGSRFVGRQFYGQTSHRKPSGYTGGSRKCPSDRNLPQIVRNFSFPPGFAVVSPMTGP